MWKLWQLWRRLVAWLRSLLVCWFLKKPIQWSNKLGELFSIIVEAIKLKEVEPVDIKPESKPESKPDYNIIPKRPLRDFIRKLLNK